MFTTAQASADLTICNQTDQPAGIAVAMDTGEAWTSAGWWTVEAGRCKSVLEGPLTATSYYLHGTHYNVGGLWEGKELFCIGRGSFAIEGREACAERGYTSAGFLKVETAGNPNWQHTLLDH